MFRPATQVPAIKYEQLTYDQHTTNIRPTYDQHTQSAAQLPSANYS